MRPLPYSRPLSLLFALLLAACNASVAPPERDAHGEPQPDRVAPSAPPAERLAAAQEEAKSTGTLHPVPLGGRAASATTVTPASPSLAELRSASEPPYRERYGHFDDNPVRLVQEHPVSTFSVDVDTGSYANLRRFLNSGRLPPADAVRIEEMLNYFSYDYPRPDDRQVPFRVTTEIAPAPWRRDSYLLQIGLQGYEIPPAQLPPANLVFLVDVSGSMDAPDKLDLLKPALKLLSRQLRPQDRVGIVVYAGASGVVLEPVAGDQRARIEAALEALNAGGSTNGGAGIRLAYALAEQHYIEGGVNRVVLATDGDFNVGVADFEALTNLVARKRKTGIALTTLGFGTGNYNDRLMEQLADVGNGSYAYIDSLKEAHKVLVRQLAGTLSTIASDVKIQIEFNPSLVSEYRLIGYENRMLNREDFNNDRVDAGDIGAGHTVTALYELTLVGAARPRVDPLRYAPAVAPVAVPGDELAFVRLRYKLPGEDRSRLLEQPLHTGDLREHLGASSERLRFAAAVAGFGQALRGGRHNESFGYPEILELARGARGADRDGYRGEFLALVEFARTLDGQRQP